MVSEICVLGSTGSVGEQALDVARQCNISVLGISANKNVDRVEAQAREFHVKYCAMADENAANDLKIKLKDTNIQVFFGSQGILDMISLLKGTSCMVVNSIIGEAGLKPTLTTLENNLELALANKESLVCAGKFVMETAKKHHKEILPVDSEHSAIFQSLRSGNKKEIKKIWLTASGGPFFGMKRNELNEITVERALAHPTWKMGAKITIDSSTLMNKGFEVIEAVHLFDVKPEQVNVVIHRESVLHSAIEYCDHSIIGQMSSPDMRLCVQYALSHPERTSAVINELDLYQLGKMTFQKPDMETFVLLQLAKDAIQQGGAVPAVINAANEVAVQAFLNKKLSYLGIMDLVTKTTNQLFDAKNASSIEDIFEFDRLARARANELLKTMS